MKLSVSAYRAHASAHKKILSSSYQTTLNYGSTAAAATSSTSSQLFSSINTETITNTNRLQKISKVVNESYTADKHSTTPSESNTTLKHSTTLSELQAVPLKNSLRLDPLHAAKSEASIFPIDAYEAFWTKSQPKCAPFPDINDLHYHNTYWQRLQPQLNVTVDLFGAYFDNRKSLKSPVVRIIAVMSVVDPKFTLSCQMWFKGSKIARITNVTEYSIIWNQKYMKLRDENYAGFLITCPLPKNEAIAPLAISLVNRPCDRATNNLRVQNNKPSDRGTKKDVVVCVKALDFPYDDLSIPFVEFLEANFMFGVDKVVTYNLGVHPNMSKVLDYYKNMGKLEVHPYSMPATFPNEPYLRHMYIRNKHTEKIVQEVIPYNDCFYKNVHLYKFVLVLDIDEIFVPMKGNTYQEMINKHFSPNHDSFFSRNKIFVRNADDKSLAKDAPAYLEFLQTVTVATNYEKPYNANVKSFFRSDTTLTLNNHMPYACVNRKCKKAEIDRKVAQLHHYRKKCCSEDRDKCSENKYKVKRDALFWRYKNEFIEKTDRTLRDLKLI